MTHADVACELVGKLPAGVFAHAARDAVLSQDFATVKKMLPGVEFSTNKIGSNRWTLAGTCRDGSVAIWQVGG